MKARIQKVWSTMLGEETYKKWILAFSPHLIIMVIGYRVQKGNV